MNDAFISVCIATYNGEKYIRQQIISILNQIGTNDEIVISDDGSTDSTLLIINEFNDKRIKVFVNGGVHGYTPNFENALKNASGKYIFLSDQDDVWFDNKVKICLNALNNYDFVYTDCVTTDAKLTPFDYSHVKAMKLKNGYWRTVIRNRFLGCCMCFNKKILERVLPFPNKYDLLEHDTWIASIAQKYYKCIILKEPLSFYRRHGGNTSDGGIDKVKKNFFKMIIRRVYRVNQTLKRRKICLTK